MLQQHSEIQIMHPKLSQDTITSECSYWLRRKFGIWFITTDYNNPRSQLEVPITRFNFIFLKFCMTLELCCTASSPVQTNSFSDNNIFISAHVQQRALSPLLTGYFFSSLCLLVLDSSSRTIKALKSSPEKICVCAPVLGCAS